MISDSGDDICQTRYCSAFRASFRRGPYSRSFTPQNCQLRLGGSSIRSPGDLRNRLSFARPGIDHFKPTSLKVIDISCHHRRPPAAGYGRYLAIGLAYRSSGGPALSRQYCVSPGSITVKWQDTFRKEHAEKPFGSGSQSPSPLPFRQDGDASPNLRFSDGGHEQVTRGLIVHPMEDFGVRALPHQFGHYIGI